MQILVTASAGRFASRFLTFEDILVDFGICAVGVLVNTKDTIVT